MAVRICLLVCRSAMRMNKTIIVRGLVSLCYVPVYIMFTFASIKTSNLLYSCHINRYDCLEKRLIQRTLLGTTKKGRPKITRLSNITDRAKMDLEMLLWVTDHRTERRKVDEADKPRSEDGSRVKTETKRQTDLFISDCIAKLSFSLYTQKLTLPGCLACAFL